MEFIASIDSVICIIVGAIVGWLAGRVMKGFGMAANVGIGVAGGLIGGLVFDKIDIIDVGDIADPVIAGVVGSVIALGIAEIFRRLQGQ
jgi:uncharacterized membrane protein YeaQ/YmgE (transglycosylase-associated protein family)